MTGPGFGGCQKELAAHRPSQVSTLQSKSKERQTEWAENVMGRRSGGGHSPRLTVGDGVVLKVKGDSDCVKTGASWRWSTESYYTLNCNPPGHRLQAVLLQASLARDVLTEVLPRPSQEDNRLHYRDQDRKPGRLTPR